MITDGRVLQTEFIPAEVRHRDEEVNYLSSILEPIINGQYPEPTLLYGPSGVGKTCIAKFIIDELQEAAGDITTQYVNCWENYTKFKTLYQLLDGLGQAYDVHRQSTPRDVLLDRLRDFEDAPYVAILDEVDQLQDKDLLYDLCRMRNLVLLLISNREEDLFSPLDERLHSRLRNTNRIHFSSYGTTELVSILRDRARLGLEEDAIGTQELRLIGDRAAGDARVAIGILRKAARQASRNNAHQIHRSVIKDVVLEAELEIERDTIDQLTPHQKTLYDIITDAGEIAPPVLYEEYSDQIEDPKTERTVRNHLAKLEHYNLIVASGNTKARIYRATSKS